MGVFSAASQWRTALLFLPGLVGQVAVPLLASLQNAGGRRPARRLHLDKCPLHHPGSFCSAAMQPPDYVLLWSGVLDPGARARGFTVFRSLASDPGPRRQSHHRLRQGLGGLLYELGLGGLLSRHRLLPPRSGLGGTGSRLCLPCRISRTCFMDLLVRCGYAPTFSDTFSDRRNRSSATCLRIRSTVLGSLLLTISPCRIGTHCSRASNQSKASSPPRNPIVRITDGLEIPFTAPPGCRSTRSSTIICTLAGGA